MEPTPCSNCGEEYAICHGGMIRAAKEAGSDLKGSERDQAHARAARAAACCRKCRHG